MSMAIDGLVSGLDTTGLIKSLMQLEAVPQALLKNKVSESTALISALQGLNTSVAGLATLAAKTAKTDSLDLFTASSSTPTVTAAVTTGASAGQIDLVVGSLAQTHLSVSDALTAWPDTGLTITSAGGTATAITAASTSLDDVVSAINAAGAGVTATKVAVGAAGFRLQLTATESGAAGSFTVSGTAAAMTEVKAGQDAQVTLWAGTSAAQAITSSTNSFANLLPGVAITVSAVSVDPVTVKVARNDAAISTVASDLVTGLNGVFALIATKSAVVNSTNGAGAPVVSGGVFTGDSTVRDINQRILSAASLPVNGRSPSEIGISISKTGTMEFNATKFAAALQKDPAGVEATLQEIASRVAVAAGAASDKFSGQITAKVSGQQSLVKDLGNRIADWDLRLASRKSSLERTYAALEVQLSNMNSQSSWLSAQIAGLPSGGA